jgi:predicted TIM-barrel fold metal-dependent hydrolase
LRLDPYWMERLDEEYEKRAAQAPLLKGKPSEYMTNGQIFYSCESEEDTLPYVLERAGEEIILYASDYAHWDSNYPNTVKSITQRATPERQTKTESSRRKRQAFVSAELASIMCSVTVVALSSLYSN